MKNSIAYTVRSNGSEFPSDYKMTGFVVSHEVNKISRAKLQFIDGDVSTQDFKISASEFFIPGREIEIDLGYESETETIFKGIVTRHAIKVKNENQSNLEIECKHAAVKLVHSTKNRIFIDTTAEEMVETILSEKSITSTFDGWPSHTLPQQVKAFQNDWDFVMDQCTKNGTYFFPQKDEIKLSPPDINQSEVVRCEYGVNVIEFQGALNSEWLSPEIEAVGWSMANQEVVRKTGTSSFQNEQGNVSSAELATIWKDEKKALYHSGNGADEELQAWSNAVVDQNELAKNQGRVRIRGVHGIWPGTLIHISGLGKRFEGKAFVSSVRHEVFQGDWHTDVQFGLSTNKSGIAIPRETSSFEANTVGIVTQLEEDPLAELRVKVKIPLIDDQDDGIWARLAQPYAGPEYGFFFYPEIGDEVILGFLNNDINEPIILGSVQSSKNPATEEVIDDNFIKGIITKSGMKLFFDDDKNTIEMSTPSGNVVLLSEDDQKIDIKDEHGNTVTLSSEGILLDSSANVEINAGQDVKIKGLNIELNASAKMEIKGSAGTKVSSSAITELKGSLVKIN